MHIKIIPILLSFLISSLIIFPREIHWDWSKIDPTAIWFPANFLWGCADSALQVEGIDIDDGKKIENSWTELENKTQLPVKVGSACERWTRYKSDFALLKQIGMKGYRFSIDWSKIEPEEGQFNGQSMQHYIDVVDELIRLGITPIVTLFHHVCPIWFMQKGSFEYDENKKYFVRFAKYIFNRLHKKVPFWIILNEPVAYAFEGYFLGNYPPGKKNFFIAGKVIHNMLNAHVAVAQEFKKLDEKPKIGIAHMCHPIDGFSSWNPFEKMVTKWFSYLMNETTIQFFKTGKFSWPPSWIKGKNKFAPRTLDFFGINYYTHTTIKQIHPFKMEARIRSEEKVVDLSKRMERSKVMYPEGLYRSIVRASKLNIPIYITENGAATEDPELREEYLKKHLYAISRAIAEGQDIRGYFFWTLTDCFSWNKGYENKHGIFAVDFETQERTYRPSTQYLIDTVARFSSN